MAPVCSRPLFRGDVITECKPLIHCLYYPFKTHFCDNCLKHSTVLKKCSNCRQMFYCDQRCQRIDWKSCHKNECKLFRNQTFKSEESLWKERLLLRLWLSIKSNETFVTKRHQLFDGSDVCLNDIEVNVNALEKDMNRLIEFKLICNHFIDYGLEFDRKELFHWFGLIGSNASVISLEIYKLIEGNENCFQQFIGYIGKGFYIQLSSLNHSCRPNSALISNGLSIQLRAMDWIESGEQITISYIDLVSDKKCRQNQLKSQFSFDCECIKCQQNQDSELDYDLAKQFDDIRRFDIRLDPKTEYLLYFNKFLLDLQVYNGFHPKISLSFSHVLNFLHRQCEDTAIQRKWTELTLATISITHGVQHPFFKIIYFLSQNFYKQ